MKLKKALNDLGITQRDVLRYINRRFKGLSNPALSEPQMSKICTGFQRPTTFSRLLIKDALAYFGLSDRKIANIEELQEQIPTRKGKLWL